MTMNVSYDCDRCGKRLAEGEQIELVVRTYDDRFPDRHGEFCVPCLQIIWLSMTNEWSKS